MIDDSELLLRYAATKSEDAFTELVRRHIDLVHAVALRQLRGNASLAQDVPKRSSPISHARQVNSRGTKSWSVGCTRRRGMPPQKSSVRRAVVVRGSRRPKRERSACDEGNSRCRSHQPCELNLVGLRRIE